VPLRATLNDAGQVAEVRSGGTPAVMVPIGTLATPDARRAATEALVRVSAEALRQWRYDPPADAPISFTVLFSFRPSGEVMALQQPQGVPGVPPPPPPPPPVPPGAFGRVDGVAPPPPPPPPPPGSPIRVGGQIRPPVRTRHVAPVYPAAAQAERVQGVVILEAIIGTDGRVQSARVLRSIPQLDQAALDAVYQWQYEPTQLNGSPVPVIMTVTVQFTLN
jgi:TonB family protein